jgi:hypothetical protein
MSVPRWLSVILVLPVLATLVVLLGCESGAVTSKGKRRPAGAGGDEAEVARVPLTAVKFGAVTGKVVYDGTPPTPRPIDMGANAASCHASPPNESENFDQYWLVDPKTNGVKNVVIMLQPTEDKFFDIPEEQRKPKPDIELTQPRCSFIPRVFVMSPSFYDKSSGELTPTGQKLVIKNDAPFPHNYNLIPNSDDNRGKNVILQPGDNSVLDYLQPQTKQVTIKCDIHSWMRCYGFLLEHPYWAITKEDGTFTIENAPLDVDLQVVAWHEAAGFFNGGEAGKKMKLPDPKGLEFKIKTK